MKKFVIILLLTQITTIQVCAASGNGIFSAAEQQQISVETPGLFAKSPMFQIDFSGLSAYYSFPLPVGKIIRATASDLELETKKGDAVKAMFEGTVRLSRNNPPFGNVIVIRHPNGLETVYGHNSENLVKSGDRVRAGQTIAIVGERNGKGYLQFSIMVNGGRIRPGLIVDTKTHLLRKTHLIFQKQGSNVIVKTVHSKDKQRAAAQTDNVSAHNGRGVSRKEIPAMNLDTNDPFNGNSVYRLNLDKIQRWHYPLDDAHVISGYGGARGHSGTDVKNGPGTNVYAAFDGKVVQEGTFAGYGKCITVRHTNGLETLYSHNSRNLVNLGDMVKAGQVIAVVGRTGRATTEHLHFETRIAGRTFNSEYIFDHKENTLQRGTLQFKRNGGVVRLK